MLEKRSMRRLWQLSCLAPKTHYCTRPMRFGSRGPFVAETSPKCVDREGLGLAWNCPQMNKRGSFSNANGDGNQIVKTTTSHVQHIFVHLFAVTARLRREILSCDVLWRTQIHHDEFFPSLSKLGSVSKNSIPGKFSYIWHFKRVGIIATKFVKKRIRVNSEVFPAVIDVPPNIGVKAWRLFLSNRDHYES